MYKCIIMTRDKNYLQECVSLIKILNAFIKYYIKYNSSIEHQPARNLGQAVQ